MEQILSFFTLDIPGLILLSSLFVLLVIQLYYYFNYYNKPIKYFTNKNNDIDTVQNIPSVSIIITAKDESHNLEKCLPAVLAQDYPDFEVIVVNEGATDETEMLLKKLKLNHPNLYSTFSPTPDTEEVIRNKVLPLTIGIKAARKDVLLFTEADSIPVSDQWIKTIVAPLNDEKNISLGYCRFDESDEFWTRSASFDNLIFSLQYLSKAIKQKPFTGVYRNIAYRRKLFFDNKGFSASLNYNSSEQIFVNQIMDSGNTTVVLNQESFVSTPLQEYEQWRDIKTSYYSAKLYFSKFTRKVFSAETCTRYLFYLVALSTIGYSIYSALWAYLIGAAIFFIIRFLTQMVVLNKAAEHFQTSKFYLSLPFFELMQPHYNAEFCSIARKFRKKKMFK